MKKVGILVGREVTFPEAIIKSINEKSNGEIQAEMVKIGVRLDEAKKLKSSSFIVDSFLIDWGFWTKTFVSI